MGLFQVKTVDPSIDGTGLRTEPTSEPFARKLAMLSEMKSSCLPPPSLVMMKDTRVKVFKKKKKL